MAKCVRLSLRLPAVIGVTFPVSGPCPPSGRSGRKPEEMPKEMSKEKTKEKQYSESRIISFYIIYDDHQI